MRQTRGKWKPAIKQGRNLVQRGYDLPRHTHGHKTDSVGAANGEVSARIFAPLDWPKPKHHTEHFHPEKRKARKGEPFA